MRAIPVLFNGAMVRAIFDDRKTQTRRIVKPHLQQVEAWRTDGHGRFYGVSRLATTGGLGVPETDFIENPLGKPGDRLWVRETTKRFTGVPVGGKPWPTEAPWVLSPDGDPYKALLHVVGNEEHVKALEYHASCVTCVSIHMPRWAARLFTDVLDVRIERLQDISEEDARAEGIAAVDGALDEALIAHIAKASGYAVDDARATFAALWASTYGAESWAANPWVWVTEFKRVT